MISKESAGGASAVLPEQSFFFYSVRGVAGQINFHSFKREKNSARAAGFSLKTPRNAEVLALVPTF